MQTAKWLSKLISSFREDMEKDINFEREFGMFEILDFITQTIINLNSFISLMAIILQ